jgi:hypothetical protein
MKTADALHRLDLLQLRIVALLDHATEMVAKPPEQAREPLAKARWALARILREYQVFKHTEIFDPAIRHGGEQHAEQARIMAARCIATGKAFTDHVIRWGSQDVVAQWTTYRPAMLAMVVRLRRALVSEKIGVAALLAGAEQTRRLRA